MKNRILNPHPAAGAVALVFALIATAGLPAAPQSAERRRPLAVLEPAPTIRFPAPTDSNSPAFWLLFRGMLRLVVLNSSPDPIISAGTELGDLDVLQPTVFRGEINGARWIEAVVSDPAGRLYGYYHNEPGGVCTDETKTAPRIGAVRSLNGGRSWTDLGIVLEAPGRPDCDTPNRYFAGGVGDFSVILDRAGNDLYFLFSGYGPALEHQGVSVARMRWSDRNAPAGQVAIWAGGIWRYPEAVDDGWVYPVSSPILPARISWHDRRRVVDAFWGPSVHWNTFLNRYVMLLNRAEDADWAQEGIYISSTAAIENPASWPAPQKLLDGGGWYPQVMGLEPGSGTDTLAGERARFFMDGESTHEIVFQAPERTAVPRQ